MSEQENILHKVFYFGLGVAGYAANKANDTLKELKQQAEKIAENPDFGSQLQQLADDMVKKGKIQADEAKAFVDEMIRQGQNKNFSHNSPNDNNEKKEPRVIEIIDDEDD